MTDSAEKAVKRAVEGVRGFAAEMSEKGIHVGLGNPGRCVTCDEPWPCAASELRECPTCGEAGKP